jgi:hypothetical protein
MIEDILFYICTAMFLVFAFTIACYDPQKKEKGKTE